MSLLSKLEQLQDPAEGPEQPEPRSPRPLLSHRVALDLGSESMVAYYEAGDDGKLLDLQHQAQQLGGKRSKGTKWLRTRIMLRDGRKGIIVNGQPALPEEHAWLRFFAEQSITGEYDSSIFDFFSSGSDYTKLLPNPKIPFQTGARDVIPEVIPNADIKAVRYAPDQIVKHIVSQIVRNFVLGSPELAGVDPKEIHLTITVPNVYSIEHAESICRFLRLAPDLNLGYTDWMYESDAVAHYVLRQHDTIPKKFHNSLKSALNSDGFVKLMTIDVGRGTTDLSYIQVFNPDADKIARAGKDDGQSATKSGASAQVYQRKHLILARTGRSDGGNRLSYILAQYYDSQLARVFREFGTGLLVNGAGAPQTEQEKDGMAPPFSFTYRKGIEASPRQMQAMLRLEELISEIKKSISADYRVEMTEDNQKELINKIVEMVEQDMPSGRILSTDGRKQIVNAFVLPYQLPSGDVVRRFADRVSYWINRKTKRFRGAEWRGGRSEPTNHSSPRMPGKNDAAELRGRIEYYVERNIVDLIRYLDEALKASAPTHQNRSALSENNTFIVIAGQAAQFKPLMDKLDTQLHDYYRIPKDRVQHLLGRAAKEACCMGAIDYIRMGIETVDKDALTGSYALYDDSAFDKLRKLSVNDLNAGKVVKNEHIQGDRWLVYAPHRVPDDWKPDFKDGMTCRICSVLPDKGEIKVRYDRAEHKMYVNDQPVELGPGKVPEAIWPKVWPERLPDEEMYDQFSSNETKTEQDYALRKQQ